MTAVKSYRIAVILAKGAWAGGDYVRACRAAAVAWDEASGRCLIPVAAVARLAQRWPARPAPPRPAAAPAPAAAASKRPCQHLGGEVRAVRCQSCRSTVQVKIYACARHGECTLSRKTPGVLRCPCPDYAAAAAGRRR